MRARLAGARIIAVLDDGRRRTADGSTHLPQVVPSPADPQPRKLLMATAAREPLPRVCGGWAARARLPAFQARARASDWQPTGPTGRMAAIAIRSPDSPESRLRAVWWKTSERSTRSSSLKCPSAAVRSIHRGRGSGTLLSREHCFMAHRESSVGSFGAERGWKPPPAAGFERLKGAGIRA
jgi:hypothetical protein